MILVLVNFSLIHMRSAIVICDSKSCPYHIYIMNILSSNV